MKVIPIVFPVKAVTTRRGKHLIVSFPVHHTLGKCLGRYESWSPTQMVSLLITVFLQ